MKTIKLFQAIIFPAFVVLLASCAKDSSTPGDPANRSAFLGTWNVQETVSKRQSYDAWITADTNSSNGVFIHNFANPGSSSKPATAAVNGTSIVLDANQVIGDDWTINGSGILAGGKITWDYTILYGTGIPIHVKATYTRP